MHKYVLKNVNYPRWDSTVLERLAQLPYSNEVLGSNLVANWVPSEWKLHVFLSL